MNWCFDQVVWGPRDAEAAAVLRQMGEFAGLEETQAAPTVYLSHATGTQIAGLIAQDAVAHDCGTLSRAREIWIDCRTYPADLPTVFGRLRQIFYLGLLPELSADCLPVHGALAECRGRGILFLGQSGMGKSTAMARLKRAGWRIYADDAVLLHGRYGIGLPTWSCGYTGAPLLFQSGAKAKLSAIIELERGRPELVPLTGMRRYGGLLRGVHDLLSQFDWKRPVHERQRLRRAAMTCSGKLIGEMPVYRLPLTLEDEFTFFLETIV